MGTPRATTSIVVATALLALSGAGLAPAQAVNGTVPACIRVSVDVRAPYNQGAHNGQCPAGYTLKNLTTAPVGPSAVTVCIKPSTDWRTPYNQGAQNGQCPAGFAKVGIAQAPGGQKVCIKPSTDVRAPSNAGVCPSGFQAKFLAVGGSPPAPTPVLLISARDDSGATPIGRELYRTDGTAAGTSLVRDINPGGGESYPEELTVIGATTYFRAYHPDTGYELWKSDGTEAGTVLVKDIFPGISDPCGGCPFPNDSIPSELTAVGSTLYFAADDGLNGRELWKSDGTAPGTVLVEDIFPGDSGCCGPNGSNPFELTAVGSTLYFNAEDGAGRELWKSDGTAPGTVLVKDIFPGISDPCGGCPFPNSSDPHDLTAVGSTLYFAAIDGVTGTELWKSDGTEAGTVLVKDIYPGIGDPCGGCPSPNSSDPHDLTAVGSTLYFAAHEGVTGIELWKSDGTEAGTVLVEDIYPGSGDPCAPGCPGPNSSDPHDLTAVGSTLYFAAHEGVTGIELWKSDGTEAGTVLVEDIYPGSGDPCGGCPVPNNSFPYDLTAVGTTLYFAAHEGVTGIELWKSDGTEAGTVLVEDIYPGSGGCCPFDSRPSFLTLFGSTLLFQADDGTTGRELWKSDGTEAGTVLVEDIFPGGGDSSYPIGEDKS